MANRRQRRFLTVLSIGKASFDWRKGKKKNIWAANTLLTYEIFVQFQLFVCLNENKCLFVSIAETLTLIMF
jgi:hypothetical protein